MNRFLLLSVALCLALGTACKPKTPHAQAAPTPAIVVEKGDPIAALANLTDPEKLATLKPEARSVNGRFDKVLYWVFVAEQRGMTPADATSKAFDANGTQEPRRSISRKQIESSYLSAKLWGLFTPENCERLKRGNAGLISKGTFIGQIAEVDHIVPVSRHPEFANEIGNLQLMPAMQNRAKGNKMGAAEFEKLRELRTIESSPVTQNQP